MNYWSRRTVVSGLAATLGAAQIRQANAQDVVALSADALLDAITDEAKSNLLSINLEVARASLVRVLFVRLKATSFSDLSQYTASKNYAAERAEYFRTVATTFDANMRAVIAAALKGDSKVRETAEAVGKAAIPSAQKMAAALAESGLIVPKASYELVQAVISFSQATAVAQKAASSTPIHCRYFPFSYFCSAA